MKNLFIAASVAWSLAAWISGLLFLNTCGAVWLIVGIVFPPVAMLAGVYNFFV